MARIMTKEELRKKLDKIDQLSHNKIRKPKNYAREYKYASIARNFLRDYSKFKIYFDTIDCDTKFTIMTTRIMHDYRENQIYPILFDSDSIVLMQLNDTLLVYFIPEYMVR